MPKKAKSSKKVKSPRKAPRMRRSNPFHVFVSHASTDKWIATTICEKIEKIGATTFRDDRDIKGGDDIPDEIWREIKRSDEMVILMSPDSVNRHWVLFEAGAFWARKQKARIVAVLCHVSVDTIPDMIKSKKAISINNFEDYVREVSTRVRAARK